MASISSEGSPSDEYETGVRKVQPLIDRLLQVLDEGVFSNTVLFPHSDYIAGYTTIYDMCTLKLAQNCGSRLYTYHETVIHEYLAQTMLPALQLRSGDESLLGEFVVRWERFQLLNKWMRKFFIYLDRYHVDHANLLKLFENGLRTFRQTVFQPIVRAVTRAVLTQISRERAGETVDHSLLKHVIEVYKAMDKEGVTTCYEQEFEVEFRKETQLYYKAAAQAWSETESTQGYLLLAAQALTRENARIAAYLLPQVSEAKISMILVDTLLREQEIFLLTREGSGLGALLRDDRREDLARVYHMFALCEPRGLAPVAEIVQIHITNEGRAIVSRRLEETPAGGEEKPEAASAFINALLDLRTHYAGLVATEFQSDAYFQKALKAAFEATINVDFSTAVGGAHTGVGVTPSDEGLTPTTTTAATAATATTTTTTMLSSTAELLATYSDSILKTGGGGGGGSEEKLSDSQIEDRLEKVVSLFNYLSDKDVFVDVYRNLLAKRLLNQRSVSPFSERSMIQKLKLMCGSFFTSKLEGMLTDLEMGKDLAREFVAYAATAQSHTAFPLPQVEFTVDVLTSGHWPTYRVLPNLVLFELAPLVELYHSFYSVHTQHRRLTWVHSLGTTLVRASYPRQSYEFNLTTLQALVMLAFNPREEAAAAMTTTTATTRTFSELTQATNIEADVLKKVLHSLSMQKVRVLVKTPGDKKMDETDVFAVDVGFSSKMRKVRIPMVSLDDFHNPARVEEDRGMAIEAAIVRIMKSRKRLNHNLLVTEVVNQLHHFRPAPKTIKKKIEHLIEREYLERDDTEPNVYRYLA